jgi:sugar lactone lactonase YvrE
VDDQGHVYVADSDTGTIQELTPAGFVVAHFRVPSGTTVSGIAVNTKADVFLSDGRNDQILQYSPSGVLLHSIGGHGFKVGELSGAAGIAVDRRDNVHVVDTLNQRVQTIAPDGRLHTEFTISFGASLVSGLAIGRRGDAFVIDSTSGDVLHMTNGKLTNYWNAIPPSPLEATSANGIAVDARGDVYIADSVHNDIEKYSASGHVVPGWGTRTVTFHSPRGVAVDAQGTVYVADTGAHRIVKLSPRGVLLAEWGGASQQLGTLGAPQGVTVDRQNHVFIADTGNGRVLEMSHEGQNLRHWGPMKGDAYLAGPNDVAIDAQGRAYVAQVDNPSITLLSNTGQVLSRRTRFAPPWGTLICPCRSTLDAQNHLYLADAYRWQEAQVSWTGAVARSFESYDPNIIRPHFRDVAIGPDGSIYMTEHKDATVTRLSASGKLLKIWGNEGSRPGQFFIPDGLTVDRGGNAYGADTGNNRVEKFSADGMLLAVIGREGSGPGQLSHPDDVAVDTLGDVYVADTGNNRIAVYAPDHARS